MRQAHEYQQIIGQLLTRVNAEPMTPSLHALQHWQAGRLLTTHAKLNEQTRFQPAIRFFTEELYCAGHFRERNEEIKRALPLMCRTMPESLLHVVMQAAELQWLSQQLDIRLLTELGPAVDFDTLSLSRWQQAYRRCANQPERLHQIDLTEALGNELARLVHKPLVRQLLHMSALPARLAGFATVHQFVSHGFEAFIRLENPQDFLQPVIGTERALCYQWFAGE